MSDESMWENLYYAESKLRRKAEVRCSELALDLRAANELIRTLLELCGQHEVFGRGWGISAIHYTDGGRSDDG